MTKRVRQDINQNKYEEKKILEHEETLEVCDSDKCVELKRRARRLDAEDK